MKLDVALSDFEVVIPQGSLSHDKLVARIEGITVLNSEEVDGASPQNDKSVHPPPFLRVSVAVLAIARGSTHVLIPCIASCI